MKILIFKTQQEFDDRERQLHDYAVRTIPGYTAEKWAEPMVNPETKEIGLILGQQVWGAVRFSETVHNVNEDWHHDKAFKPMGFVQDAQIRHEKINWLKSIYQAIKRWIFGAI